MGQWMAVPRGRPKVLTNGASYTYDATATSMTHSGACSFSVASQSHYKFTGKERDGESGMDDFGARYYASYMGRFMIPDWAAKATSVPYASFGDPQSLNLYSYVRNHPTVTVDPSGHVKMSMEQVSGGTDAEVANYFEQSGGVNEEGASGNGKNSGGGKCGNNVNCVDVVAPAPPRVETLDSYFAAAFGHHGFPVSLFRFLKNLNPSAYRFLNREFVTGRLAQRHVYDAAHRAYSKSVDELLDLQTAEGRAAVAEDAKAAAQKILDSDAPEISDFLDNLETANGMTGREVLQGVLDGVEADGAAEGLLLGLL